MRVARQTAMETSRCASTSLRWKKKRCAKFLSVHRALATKSHTVGFP